MSTKERRTKEIENRKEEILNAAFSIMEDVGVHKLNIDRVASTTHLAKGTIYLYFKNKEEILASLNIRARQMLYNEFLKVTKKNIPAIDKIKGFVKANFSFAKKHSVYYGLFSLYEVDNLVTETEEMYQWSHNISQLVSTIVKDAQAEGTLNRDVDADQFTMCLYGATVGVLQLVKVRGKLIKDKMKINENQLVNTFLSVLEKGIGS